MEERTFCDGARVDVWQQDRCRWQPGIVIGFATRCGVGHYLVKFRPLGVLDAEEPGGWFRADQIRRAR
jgi:hypothetical protein